MGLKTFFLCGVVLLFCGSIHAAPASTAKKRAGQQSIAGGQWSQDHYSSLTQINRHNVNKLSIAWKFDTGEGGEGIETNPLVVGRVLYAYTASQKVIAVDATNGKLIWKFDSGVLADQPARGISYWSDGNQRFLLCGIMNYLYELDAATGKLVEHFGEAGRINLRKGLGGDYRKQSIVLTSPGIVYKDLIIVGGRNPETPPAPPGDIRAFNIHTGQLAWDFHTIPRPGESGYETWPKDAWRSAGAANNWAGMALDEKRGIVYVPTGSAVPDFYGGARIGDDRFADCLLALNAATGKLIWSFQGVHHDVWDRDFPAPPVLLRVKRNGSWIDAVAQTTKQGFVFLFDRETGKPLFPIEERLVPGTNVPGEVSAKTQPFPLAPAPYARQTLTFSDLTNRTPAAHEYALTQFRQFIHSTGQFYPLSVGRETIVAPGFDGGGEWGGPGVDRRSGVIYINANNVVDTGSLAINDRTAELGLRIYRTQCALCHRDNRAGSPPEYPSLVGIKDKLSASLITQTIHSGKGRMPSFPNILGPDLTALLNYLNTTNDAADVTDGGKELRHDAIADHAPKAERSAADALGQEVYAKQCAICHGDHLEGIAPSFPSLNGIGSRMTAQQIISIVHTGRGRMPPFDATRIPDADMSSLVRFLNASTISAIHVSESERDAAIDEMDRYRFTGYHKFQDQDGYPAVSPPWGTLNAIDLNTGKYLWTVPLGFYPELAAKGMGNTGTENYGGPIVTAGGLVIIGATVFDKKIRAFDSRTGHLLWDWTLPYAAAATPTTYMADGKQFVVIASGGSKFKHTKDAFYIAFSLP